MVKSFAPYFSGISRADEKCCLINARLHSVLNVVLFNIYIVLCHIVIAVTVKLDISEYVVSPPVHHILRCFSL
jgi:hypothetical protein